MSSVKEDTIWLIVTVRVETSPKGLSPADLPVGECLGGEILTICTETRFSEHGKTWITSVPGAARRYLHNH